jgi:polysaccharide biosynthesis/export protein
MRVATWSVVLAALPLICYGTGLSQEKAADPVSHPQEQSASSSAQPAGAPSAGARDSQPAAPGSLETDPEKMAQSAKPETAPGDASYVIGAEDVLGIQVWGDPRLSGEFLVRPDGRISMSLVGEVMASGLSPSQLEKSVSDLLKAKEILKNPQVAVQVKQINSKKYFLQGEVNKTGAYPLVVPTTVLEALVNAGGFRDFANEKKIEVIRGLQRFKFNYKDVIKGRHTEQNILLKPGDIIIVP